MPRCKQCKDKFKPRFFNQKFCMEKNDCIKAFMDSIREKKEKEKFTILKEKSTNWKKKLQLKVQEIARNIDKGLPCLARGTTGQMHGGHVYARGGNSYMALNLHNIHRQGAQSNHFQNDDAILREGLVNEYGKDYMQFISDLRSTPELKYSNIQYMDFYKKACKISNKLKKANMAYGLTTRIKLRNDFNTELGIYQQQYCIYK